MSKDEINKLIGVRLKSARKDRGLTLLELSQKVGLSEGNVQRYEAGNIANVSIAVLLKFASALYVPPEQLLGWKSGTDGEVLAPDEESLLSKYRRLDDRRQYAVQGYADSKLEEQERETGELYEERIKEA